MALPIKKLSREQYLAQREQWIKEHGSPRLKRCLAEGIECNGVYLSELERYCAELERVRIVMLAKNLEKKYPGWLKREWLHGELKSSAVNPDMDAFDMLDAARVTFPSAKMGYYKDEVYEGYVAVAYCEDLKCDLVYGWVDE